MDSLQTEKQPLDAMLLSLPEWGGIRAGSLAVHIANSADDVRAAQALRYRIFYGEMGGTPSAEARAAQRDFDRFDACCDHLLVLDYDQPEGSAQVVGTYRLLRRSRMWELGHFYSEGEFDISAIVHEEGEILELGRSCVDARYRNRAVMQLLWRGIGAYVTLHDIKLMFGCASFIGLDVTKHAMALSYLHHYHLAPKHLRIRALKEQYIEMNRMERDAFNPREAFAALPALIKGYLRVGGFVGDGAVLDRQCNTLDVGIVVKTELVTDKYVQRYFSAAWHCGE